MVPVEHWGCPCSLHVGGGGGQEQASQGPHGDRLSIGKATAGKADAAIFVLRGGGWGRRGGAGVRQGGLVS